MTLIDTIQQNENRDQIKDVKTVKNAKIFFSNGIVFCQHYQEIIFAFDMNNKICEIQKDLSQTSNRQIKYLTEALNIENAINVSRHNKWEFRESL